MLADSGMATDDGIAHKALQNFNADEFKDMEDDEASTGSPSSSDEVPLESVPAQAALPIGLQLASRGAGCAPNRIDPLDIRFSQMKMRHLFGDGRRIADTVLQVSAEPCTEAEHIEHSADFILKFPFPMIEVIRWKCKLRDSITGRPLVDEETGEEIYDSEEHWFTLDNRRLYCLQEAALRVWPQRCVVEVAVIISGPHAHMRELRKFRTLDRGRSAMIGSRADGVAFVRWCWREQVGIEESKLDDGDVEAELHPELRLPKELKHGRKPAPTRREDQTVFDHLSTLEPDDFERIEVSKKISWILRHGLWSSDDRCSINSEDGWVLMSEMLKVESLNGLSMNRLLDVVSASNKQKPRYETRESKEGMFIRASGRKGRTVRNKSEREDKARDVKLSRSMQALEDDAKTPSAAVAGKSSGGAAKDSRMSPEKTQSRPPGALEKASSPAAKAPKETRPQFDNTETAAEAAVMMAAAEGRKAEVAAALAKKKMAGAKIHPGTVDRQNMMLNAYMRNMSMGAMMGGAFGAAQPPGPVIPPSAAAHLQFMQQMKAMQQMIAAGVQQMQVRRLMQIRMMRQFQAMQAYQMQFQAVNAMQHMQAMQEMQAFYESMEWDEEDEEQEEEEEDVEKVPETADELEARIQEVLHAAKARAVPSPVASSKPATSEDLENKIAEALQAAAARTAKAAQAAKPSPPVMAKSKTARPAPLAAEDMDAKIAKALEGAKSRGAASAPKKEAIPAKPPPKKVKEPDANLSIEDKIALALEAAKERRAENDRK